MPPPVPPAIAALAPVAEVLRGGSAAVLVLDARVERTVWANEAGASLIGLAAGEVAGRPLPRTVGQRRIAAAARGLAEGRVRTVTARLSADIGVPLATFDVQRTETGDGPVVVLRSDAVASAGLDEPSRGRPKGDPSSIIPPEEFRADAPSFSDRASKTPELSDERGLPTPRFTWRSDANGTFTDISPEFLDALEVVRDEIVGRDATGLDRLCHADRDRLGNALADDAAFTHRTVSWSVPRIGVRVPVAFSGVPQFDGTRFTGHRGHGKVRLADAILDDEGSPHAKQERAREPDGPTPPPPANGLSPSEREAFDEIATVLGSDAPPAPAPGSAGEQSPASHEDGGNASVAHDDVARLNPSANGVAPFDDAAGDEATPATDATVGDAEPKHDAPVPNDAPKRDGATVTGDKHISLDGEPSPSRDADASVPSSSEPKPAPIETLGMPADEQATDEEAAAADTAPRPTQDGDQPEDAIGETEREGPLVPHPVAKTVAGRAIAKVRDRSTDARRDPLPKTTVGAENGARRATSRAVPLGAKSGAMSDANGTRFGRRLAQATAPRSGNVSPDQVSETARPIAPKPVVAKKRSRSLRARNVVSGTAPRAQARSVTAAAVPGKRSDANVTNTIEPAPIPSADNPRDFEGDLANLAALSRVDQPLPRDDGALASSGSASPGSAFGGSATRVPNVEGRGSSVGSSANGSTDEPFEAIDPDGSGEAEPPAYAAASPESEAEPNATIAAGPAPDRTVGIPPPAAEELVPDHGGSDASDGTDAVQDDEASTDAAPPVPRAVDTTLLAQLPIAVLVQGQRELLYCNGAFAELTGYETIDALRDAGGLNALFGDTSPFDGHDDAAGAMVLRTAGGTRRPVSVQMQSVPWAGEGSDSGNATLLTLRRGSERGTVMVEGDQIDGDDPIALPFTDRRPIESRLASLNQVLDEATDGVVFLDGERNIRALSRSAGELLGYRDDEIAGRAFAALFAPDSRQAATDLVAGLGGDGPRRGKGIELIAQTAADDEVPLFVTVGALRDEGGFCAVLRDVSEWKRTEESLREAREEAEAASRQKTRFLTRVSHEIRTPLNAIIGFAEVMSEERFGPIANERYRDYLTDISVSGRHVLDLVNDLLDIAKIEAGRDELSFEAVDLNNELQGAVTMLEPQAEEGRIIVRTALGALPPIVADRRSIRQIAINILSNAVRYTDAGGQVIVSTKAVAGGVTLRVRDTGVGMSQDDIDRALEPFTQVPSRSESMARRSRSGTGLGLPLTKAMAEANRARFSISSVRGRGTLVELHFPPDRVLR